MKFKDDVNKLRSDLRAIIEQRLVEFYKEHGLWPHDVNIHFVEVTHTASHNREWRLASVDVSFKL